MRRAVSIKLTPEEASKLRTMAQSGRSEVREALRAKIVLMAAEGLENKEIAAALSTEHQQP